MDNELLKKISKEGNLHPSNKVMDILRKVVRATKEEDAKICEDEIASWQRATMSCQDEKIALGMAAKSIRASK